MENSIEAAAATSSRRPHLALLPARHGPPDPHGRTGQAPCRPPCLRDALSRLRSSDNLVAFVADIFGTDAFDVSRELGVPPSSSTSPSS
ncbi:hypothetical protein OPV22_020340 [Ensete ventricosum]|uniref:Uncharacterized protein n=1 Tax=Ensete ventricosum TaxID=4639 RepID=A0AAV8QIL5_ENSVE|nr:hypothetical protein OPV22_020340 [Ensete ventricosum]